MPLMRAAVDHLFGEGRLLACSAAPADVLGETPPDVGAKGDVAEAEVAIERWAKSLGFEGHIEWAEAMP
jgi:hypothetical protein